MYRAVVVDNQDPEQRGRVRLAVPELFMDAEGGVVVDSPWVEARGAAGAVLDVPDVGTQVWASVEHSTSGDAFDLVYERGPHGVDSRGASTAPATGRGVDDESVTLKVSAPFSLPGPNVALSRRNARGEETRPSTADERIDVEMPTSRNAGRYPHNRVLKTSGGMVLEWDDTPGNERVQVHHPSGAGVEIGARGSWSQRAAKRFDEVLEHDVRRIGGDLRERVDGNEIRGVGGNSVTEVGGRSVLLAGEVDVRARSDLLMEVAGMMRQKVVGTAVQQFISDWNVICGGAAQISSVTNLGLLSARGSNTLAAATNAVIVGGTGVNIASPVAVNVSAPLLNVAAASATFVSPAGVHVLGLVGGLPKPVVILNDALIELLVAMIDHTHPALDPTAEGNVAAKSPQMLALGTQAVPRIASPYLLAQGLGA